MQQELASASALPTPAPGASVRPLIGIQTDQLDQITQTLEHVKSLVYLLAQAHDAELPEGNTRGLSCSMVVDDLLDQVEGILMAGEMIHD